MISHSEKPDPTVHAEHSVPLKSPSSRHDELDLSPSEEKRILRRIDARLIPIVGALYCVSLIDRTNLGAAAIAGMLEDLRLIGNRYVSYVAGVWSLSHRLMKQLSLVGCLSCLLYHLYRLPATVNHHRTQVGAAHPPTHNHAALGDCYGRHGFD
jgi:hypothetical protein